jgi:hypothetical protein
LFRVLRLRIFSKTQNPKPKRTPLVLIGRIGHWVLNWLGTPMHPDSTHGSKRLPPRLRIHEVGALVFLRALSQSILRQHLLGVKLAIFNTENATATTTIKKQYPK